MDDEAIKFFNKGTAHFKAGKFDLAIAAFTKAIALEPEYVEAFNNRGLTYGKKGEFDLAIEDLNQAIELNPEYAEAFNNRGSAYDHKGEFNRAIEDYNQAIKLNPEYAEAFNNRGSTYGKKGEFDLAIEDYNQAIKLNPEYAEAFNNRGNAYLKQGKFDLAIEDFNQAIKLNPEYAEAFYNRGLAYRATGNERDALRDFQQANRLDPTVISKKESEETRKEVKEVQGFQSILEELRKEHKTGENGWFSASILIVAVVFVGLLFITLRPESDYKTFYPIYVFSSVITLIIIRQYTNAKQLRIEASNRLAMAKMFEKIQQTKDNPHYQDFIPRIIDSIAYSMYKNHKESTLKIIEELKSIFKK